MNNLSGLGVILNYATYQRQLNREMGEKHLLRACPLLSSSRYLVGLELPLVEVRNGVDDDPWDAASKVHDLGTQEFISAIPCSEKAGRQRSVVLSGAVKPNIWLGYPVKK